jgi:hypothetical protein
MSHDVTPRAYQTRLGNISAKGVLALLADTANDDGYGWPSVERIAQKTEIRARTVMRILQVFGKIGLISKVDRGRGKTKGLQLNLEMLGADLSAEFDRAYRKAQRKCRSDTADGGVAATLFGVAETLPSVAATLPLQPLIGVTVIEPSGNRQQATAPEELGLPELDAEQKQHVDDLLAKGRKGDAQMWERYYREQNQAAAQASIEKTVERDRDAELRDAIPTVRAARHWVMRACRFVQSRRGSELEQTIEAVLHLEANAGIEFWQTARDMAAAWKDYQANGEFLRVLYGPVKFFEIGIWRDRRGWAWDQQKMRDHKSSAEARAGGR